MSKNQVPSTRPESKLLSNIDYDNDHETKPKILGE